MVLVIMDRHSKSYQRECDVLAMIQHGFGRWLWEVGNERNELVRGEFWMEFIRGKGCEMYRGLG